jgi:hypothetical protein
MFLACIFSSKIVATEEMRLFFFAFSEGGVNERKKVRRSLKNTNRYTLIYSVFTHTKHTHTHREHRCFRRLSREFERILASRA